MKAKINRVNVDLIALPGEPDCMNNTTVFANDVAVWPTHYGEERPERPFDIIEEGNELSITIPSGILTGTVSNVLCMDNRPDLIRVVLTDAVWNGQYAGMNGLCGAGGWEFRVVDVTAIETSVAEDLITIGDYLLVRTIAEQVKDCFGFPEENRKLLQKTWSAVKTLREEVKDE
jgi:hypothetical protein